MGFAQASTAKVASSTEKQVPAVISVANLTSYLTTGAFNDNARQTVSSQQHLHTTPVDSMQALLAKT